MGHNMEKGSKASKSTMDWTSVLDLFPGYSDIFRQTQARLTSGNGPLPLPERHYIALMGSSITGCESLERLQEQTFIRAGGEKAWLAGQVPARLRRLEPVNAVLAHRPSALSAAHIKALLKNESSEAGSQDTWTLAEAVQAIVILANYHALSSLCLGVSTRLASASSNFKADKAMQMKVLKYKLRAKEEGLGLHQQQSANNSVTLLDLKSSRLAMLDERKRWRLANKELKRKRSFSEGEVVSQTDLVLKRALGDSEGAKSLESREDCSGRELLVQEFSWDDQGFCVMSNFYSDIAVLLDDKFRLASGLVDTMEEDKEQEAIFRRAVWNYVQSLFLVRHDDYDYSDLDTLLPPLLREFIDLCCRPLAGGGGISSTMAFLAKKLNYSTKLEWSSQALFKADRNLRNNFQVRVSILVQEARLQSELLFALQAVMRHMS